jgi:hypothetical protein
MNGVNGCDICPPEKNCTGPTSDPADPHWDGTDGAHPAWWRGQAAGIETACREIDRILADPMRVLSSSGKASEPWQSTRIKIASVAVNLGCVAADRDSKAQALEYVRQRRDELDLELREAKRALAVFAEREKREQRT